MATPKNRIFRLYRRELPVQRIGYYSGDATTWQTLAIWRVGHIFAKRYGELHQIILNCGANDYAHVTFRFRIERPPVKITMYDDLTITQALEFRWPENELARETEVILECMTDGTEVTDVFGSICGTEWEPISEAELIEE